MEAEPASCSAAGDLQAAGAVASVALPPAAGGESHLRLLHAALREADAARREAERDNERLRSELATLQEHLARVLARVAATRAVVVVADENCGAEPPPEDAGGPQKPPVFSDAAAEVGSAAVPEARRALVPAQQLGGAVCVPEADDPSDAREGLLRRRAAALGLAGSALFPKAMHRV